MIKSVKLFFPDAQVIVSKDDDGNGKGWAIREGLKQATGDTIVLIDADLDIHAAEIRNLLPYLLYYDVVIGYKDLKRLPPRRKIVSFGYRLLVRCLFRLRIKDSQSGLKIWKRRTMPEFKTNNFSYDVELLAKARKANLRIKEVPIKCRIYSQVSFKAIWQTLKGTIRIWLENL